MDQEFYIVAITALLPLIACLLIVQVNPYHALVIRGILGAVAALVYSLYGAADVALTEALVGTMLSITLYAVAVRSSMSMRLGVLEHELQIRPQIPAIATEPSDQQSSFELLLPALRQAMSKYHMRLELVPYPNLQALQTALQDKEVHTICIPLEATDKEQPYHIQTRIQRLYEVMQPVLPLTVAALTCIKPEVLSQTTIDQPNIETPDPVEVQS